MADTKGQVKVRTSTASYRELEALAAHYTTLRGHPVSLADMNSEAIHEKAVRDLPITNANTQSTKRISGPTHTSRRIMPSTEGAAS